MGRNCHSQSHSRLPRAWVGLTWYLRKGRSHLENRLAGNTQTLRCPFTPSETAAHPRILFKPRTLGTIPVTPTSSASLRAGVVKTFRCPGRVRQMDELFTRLDRIASQMDALRWSPDAELNYDMMAGAIWWSDERPNFRQAEDHWCLRPVFRYRTAMILETPEPKWQLFWDRATELFPNWPGFHLSRTTPNPELVAFHNSKSKIAMDSFLEGVDDPDLREEMRREMDD